MMKCWRRLTRDCLWICLLGLSRVVACWGDIQVTAWGDVNQSDVPAGMTNVVAVAAGHFHNLSLTAAGKILAWPISNFDSGSMVPADITNAVRISAGIAHDLALRADGTLVAWGDRTYGQTTVPRGLTNAIAVAAGGYHSLALSSDGVVRAWGDNSYGQISVPPQATNVVAIAAGFYHSMALRMDGTVVTWGDNSFGQTEVPGGLTNAAAIAAGGDHCLALRSSGDVIGWGDDSYGQASAPTDLTNAVAIAAGDYHSLAVRGDRTVAAWGPPQLAAVKKPASLSHVVMVGAGGLHSLAMANDGGPFLTAPQAYRAAAAGSKVALRSSIPQVSSLTFQWKLNGTDLTGETHSLLEMKDVQVNQSGIYSVVVHNAFGIMSSEATLVSIVPELIFISPKSQTNYAGARVELAVATGSTARLEYQWRFNGTNLPGANNDTLVLPSATPEQAGVYSVILSNAYGVVTSPEAQLSVISLLEWGQVRRRLPAHRNLMSAALGKNPDGWILALDADGTAEMLPSGKLSIGPVPPDLTNVTAVAAGWQTAIALREDGTVLAWGDNRFGETNIPPALSNVVSIAAGDFHNLALKSDGTLAGWGDNSDGQREILTRLANIVSVGAGSDRSCAVTSDGQVLVWGGSGHFSPPPGLSNIIAAAVGESHFLALKSDGSVVSWGNNFKGQTNVPADLRNVVAISSAADESMAITAGGQVVVWGSNYGGGSGFPVDVTNAVAAAAGPFNNLLLLGSGPPRFTASLISRSVAAGATTSFRSVVSGSLPLRYQWQFDGKDLTGETNSVLTVHDVGPGNAGVYSVTVSNVWAVARSESASLTVAPVLINALLSDPDGQPAAEGGSASFTVMAQGTGLSYQWRRDGIFIAGATNSTLTLTNLPPSQAGAYSAIASNALGLAVSASVPLNVLPLWITLEPHSQTNYAGGSVEFEFGVKGLDLRYQWLRNGLAIPGATNSTLTLTNLQLNQAGAYSAIVSNAFGTTNSASASLEIEPFLFGFQPQSQTNFPGNEVFFNVRAVGTGPFQYQWQFNGADLPGATNDALTFSHVRPDQSGIYSVTLSNTYGSATSQTVMLAVINLVEWQSRSPEKSNLLSVPSEIRSISVSSAGWALATTGDGRVTALPGSGVSAPIVPPDLTNAIAVAAGWDHALALRADGTVAAWGDNRFGETNLPAGLTGVVRIASGEFHDLALRSDGTVVGWGANNFGQTNVPLGLMNVVDVAASTNASMAVTRDGAVFVWGADGVGRRLSVPADWTNIVGVAAANSHFLALRIDGTAVVWGNDLPQGTPMPLNLTNVLRIAAKGDHDLELTAGGKVASWVAPTNLPSNLENVVGIAAGENELALIGSGPPAAQINILKWDYDGHGFALLIPTEPETVYSVESTDTLTATNWSGLPLVAGNGRPQWLRDSVVRGMKRFYRIRRW